MTQPGQNMTCGISDYAPKHYQSGGQRRRVGIGVALMNPSKLVILDEPTAGIDPKTRHDIWGLLKKMRLSGKAIVLSSHSMEECEALCSRIGVLVKGRLVAIGASQALKTRTRGIRLKQRDNPKRAPCVPHAGVSENLAVVRFCGSRCVTDDLSQSDQYSHKPLAVDACPGLSHV
ncbi:hypothetical protein ANCDUO_10090 [Ancylostoma duodenale]|uniref:ABC transporter domain-containing protein n=1 Tax=Ancylostoma duodenale TaxID=51022 RepID=A0A0C2GES0_9BILA|nr:hypothetical protein ANCDUO_10090 [Ancylostoma duodenale]